MIPFKNLGESRQLRPDFLDSYDFSKYHTKRNRIVSLSGCTVAIDGDGYHVEVNSTETCSFTTPPELSMTEGAITFYVKDISTAASFARFLFTSTGNFEFYRSSTTTDTYLCKLNGTVSTFSSAPSVYDGNLHTVTIAWYAGQTRLLIDESYDSTVANARSDVALTSTLYVGSNNTGGNETNSGFYGLVIHKDYDAERITAVHSNTNTAFLEEDVIGYVSKSITGTMSITVPAASTSMAAGVIAGSAIVGTMSITLPSISSDLYGYLGTLQESTTYSTTSEYIAIDAICDRCGFRYGRSQLRDDGQSKGIKVCRHCWDSRHPQESIRAKKEFIPDWDRPNTHTDDSIAYVDNINSALEAGTSPVILNYNTALTANRTVELSESSAKLGDRFTIYRTAGGSYTLTITGITTIPADVNAIVIVEYNGSGWRLVSYGTL